MGKMQRRKGHSYEREIANLFKPLFPEAKRHLEYQAQEARGYDIDNTPPFLIQCKRGRKAASISKIKEVQSNDPSHIPLLITKGDNEPSYVVLQLDHFLTILDKVASAHGTIQKETFSKHLAADDPAGWF